MMRKGNKLLKFERAAKVGDVIRGYDFKPMVGRNDCFVEGTVIKITSEAGYKAFKIKCIKEVFDGEIRTTAGKGSRVGKNVYVPMEVSFMEYDARIINLSK